MVYETGEIREFSPLLLEFDFDGSGFFVTSVKDRSFFGYGETIKEAICDLAETIVNEIEMFSCEDIPEENRIEMARSLHSIFGARALFSV